MATLKLDIPGLSGGGDDQQQQQPQAPPPPPPPLNFAQFASNPMAQQKVSAMIPGLPPPPPPQQVASGGPPPFKPPAPPAAPPAPTPPPSAPAPQPMTSAPSPAGPSPSPMQSYQDWQGANPNMQEQQYSGVQKALRLAAGIVSGGAPGGVQAGAAIHQHDLPAGLQGIDQQRYQQAVVQPYQTQQGIADTQAQMQQREALAGKADAQAQEYAPQMVTPEQASALGMPQLAGVTMNSRDLANLSGKHDTNTASQANAQTRAGAQTTAATTRAGGQVEAATVRASAAPRLKGRAAGAGMGAIPATGTTGYDSLVTAIGEGRQPLPRGSSARVLALAQAVNQKYPHYSATAFNTYQKSENNLVAGAGGQAINAFNTGLQHLGEVEQHLPQNGHLPVANALKNSLLRASGDPRLAAFDTARTAVLGEIAKAYHGGVVPQADEAKYEKLLDPNASPEQMKANINEFKQLLAGKLESYNYQRQQGQPATQGGPIMSPGAASVMNESGGYSNLHRNAQTGQTIGLKGGKWFDTKTGQAVQ